MSLYQLFKSLSGLLSQQHFGTKILDQDGDKKDTGVQELSNALQQGMGSQAPISINEPIVFDNTSGDPNSPAIRIYTSSGPNGLSGGGIQFVDPVTGIVTDFNPTTISVSVPTATAQGTQVNTSVLDLLTGLQQFLTSSGGGPTTQLTQQQIIDLINQLILQNVPGPTPGSGGGVVNPIGTPNPGNIKGMNVSVVRDHNEANVLVSNQNCQGVIRIFQLQDDLNPGINNKVTGIDFDTTNTPDQVVTGGGSSTPGGGIPLNANSPALFDVWGAYLSAQVAQYEFVPCFLDCSGWTANGKAAFVPRWQALNAAGGGGGGGGSPPECGDIQTAVTGTFPYVISIDSAGVNGDCSLSITYTIGSFYFCRGRLFGAS